MLRSPGEAFIARFPENQLFFVTNLESKCDGHRRTRVSELQTFVCAKLVPLLGSGIDDTGQRTISARTSSKVLKISVSTLRAKKQRWGSLAF